MPCTSFVTMSDRTNPHHWHDGRGVGGVWSPLWRGVDHHSLPPRSIKRLMSGSGRSNRIMLLVLDLYCPLGFEQDSRSKAASCMDEGHGWTKID